MHIWLATSSSRPWHDQLQDALKSTGNKQGSHTFFLNLNTHSEYIYYEHSYQAVHTCMYVFSNALYFDSHAGIKYATTLIANPTSLEELIISPIAHSC